MDTYSRTSAQCEECLKGPFLLTNLYKHMRNVHKYEEEEIRQMKEDIRITKFEGRMEYPCDICGKMYFSKYGRRQHMMETHDYRRRSVRCPRCATNFAKQIDLAKHCMKEHSIEGRLTIVEQEFYNVEIFEKWKKDMEAKTSTRLVKRNSWKFMQGSTTTYVCHLSQGNGEFEDPLQRKDRYRRVKRVHRYCPCFLKVTHHNNGKVEAVGYFGHVGHSTTSASLPISKRHEMHIKEMLEAGVPPRKILSKLATKNLEADQVGEGESALCHATMKDIANIAQRYGLIDGRTANDDIESLYNLLQNMSSSIAAYKFTQGNESKGDGLLLAFITSAGKSYLERFGYRGVVIDDTFNVTRYPFRLATLLITDDAGNGFPCAYLLSYRMTCEEIEALFTLVKETIPNFDTQYVITDDTNVFYKGFSRAFPSSRAAKLLCSFHISQSLKRKHKELLKGTHIPLADHMVRRLLREANVSKFESQFSSYMSWLISIEASDMVEYLEKNYSGRRIEWAACYRKHAPFTTTNHAEAWHASLKRVVLDRKQNNRLDTLVHALLQHSHHRYIHLTSMGLRRGVNFRQSRNLKRHRDALAYYKDGERLIEMLSEKQWKVYSKANDGLYYVVTVDEATCSCDEKINSHCLRCGVCAFQVSCTCPEGHRAGVSCLHAHAVASLVDRECMCIRPARKMFAVVSNSETEDVPKYFVSSYEYAAQSELVAPDVVEKDTLRESFQACENAYAVLGEMIESLKKEKNCDAILTISSAIERVINSVPKPANMKTIAKRPDIQRSGPAVKSRPIQGAFKKRPALKLERRRKRRRLDDDEGLSSEAERILATGHELLQTCFVCGRRDPSDDGSLIVEWVSCSNCNAWGHLLCISNIGDECNICQQGAWQFEPTDEY